MTTLPRSSVIQPGDIVRLGAGFVGPDGLPVDLDAFPQVTIVAPPGGVVAGPTSTGVYRTAVGVYYFEYAVGLFPAIGVWTDTWSGTLDGFTVSQTFTFQVNTTQLPEINTDGYVHLGDDPGYNFSQDAIININNLLKSLKLRLNSSGKKQTLDEYGNIIYKDCDVFSTDQLVGFICQALTMFNEVPHFTEFTYEDTEVIHLFHDVLVQGATLIALSSQALIERGREFQITDNGIGFTPPTMSEMLNTQWQSELNNWWEKLKEIKHNMKPSPIGLGGVSFPGVSPRIRRLRTLRARQIY